MIPEVREAMRGWIAARRAAFPTSENNGVDLVAAMRKCEDCLDALDVAEKELEKERKRRSNACAAVVIAQERLLKQGKRIAELEAELDRSQGGIGAELHGDDIP